MIFVGMATTYTALWMVVLDGLLSDLVLGYVWVASFVGILAKLRWIDAHPTRHWVGYIAFSIVGLVVLPELLRSMGPLGVLLIALGAMSFALGGAAFAIGRPNPFPRWIGSHEVFHVGTLIGCAMFMSALATVTFG